MANHPNRGRRIGRLAEFRVEAEQGLFLMALRVSPKEGLAVIDAMYDGHELRNTCPPFDAVATPAKAMRWLAEPFREFPSRLAYMEAGYRDAARPGQGQPPAQPFRPEHTPL